MNTHKTLSCFYHFQALLIDNNLCLGVTEQSLMYYFDFTQMDTEYDYLFKIVLIGDAGVGKTSIVRRYTDGIFTSAGIPTIGVDFCIKTLQIGSSAVKVCTNHVL